MRDLNEMREEFEQLVQAGRRMEKPPAGMHVMQVMDRNGHTTVTWDPRDPASINEARVEFDRLVREGYQAFRMDVVHEDGVVVEEKGERITEFDPQAGKVMMVPHLRGG